MKILMVTNTYKPHVGGVARSVDLFTRSYRELGHDVFIVAPEFSGVDGTEEGVIRVPAVRGFNSSDFSVRLPVPANLSERVSEFKADIIHSHHPFLLGGVALRMSRQFDVPLVYTYHTMYENYTHYVSIQSGRFKRFATMLCAGYCDLCDRVFAPSESIREHLKGLGVSVPIDVVPTGVQLDEFTMGDGNAVRHILGIPKGAFVIGHVGRIALEKNLRFLTEAVCEYMADQPNAHFILAGTGPLLGDVRKVFMGAQLSDRFHVVGVIEKEFLVSCYKAMDVFTFASLSETQGFGTR